MLMKLDVGIEIDAILDSLVSAREWFRDNSPPDLAFLDIQLGDGTSFELLQELNVTFPVIFTTAFDQYAIKAFKYQSIDYLLKPIGEEELGQAVEKYQRSNGLPLQHLTHDVTTTHRLITGDFKKRFLIKIGDQYKPVAIEEVAYFYSNENQTYLMTLSGKYFPVDQSLEQIENSINPLEFFRVSRKMLIGLSAIDEVHTYFNSRLLIKLQPSTDLECIVSRERVSDFKSWMDL
jgi:DNA-binding LytR/AlgR family response regulator